LAGTSYYGPVAGHGFISRDLDEIREERKRILPENMGMIKGDMEAVSAGEAADNYVIIRKKVERGEKSEENSDSENHNAERK
jgi:hypothetical protein